MAKFKVLQKYKDLELGKTLQVDEEVDMTVKRADEVNEKLVERGAFLERVEEAKKKVDKKKTKGE